MQIETFGSDLDMSAPKKTGQVEDAPRSDALVIFGFTGDLASKKIFPALYAMVKKGDADRAGHRRRIVEPGAPIRCTARSRQRRARRRRSTTSRRSTGSSRCCATSAATTRTPATFAGAEGRARPGAQRPAHYLAIPPALFATVIRSLGAAGLARERPRHRRKAVRPRPGLGASSSTPIAHVGVSRSRRSSASTTTSARRRS